MAEIKTLCINDKWLTESKFTSFSVIYEQIL